MNVAHPFTRSSTATLAVNVLAFQFGWFAMVLSAAHGQSWLGLLVAGMVIAWHVLNVPRPAMEARLVIVSLGLGALIETLNALLGLFAVAGRQFAFPLPAPWLIALWGLLAITLNVSLRWLKQRSWLAALLGVISGPLAYMAGAKLGALQFTNENAGMLALAIEWAICMPLLMKLSMAFDGVQMNAATQSVAETPA